MILITIVDVETTGLNPDTDEVIEVAAILYSDDHGAILQQVSTLLPVEENPAYDTNGISVAMSEASVMCWDSQDFIVRAISEMMKASDYVIAFNADFDRSFMEGHSTLWTTAKPWADAAAITYPRQSTKKDLVNIALANGIPVVNAHRALDDCRLVADLLGKVPDLEAQLALAARPKATVKALVSFEQKELAKAAGFVWDAIVPRSWAKRMPAEDAQTLPFAVEVLG